MNGITCRGHLVLSQVSPHRPCFIERAIRHLHIRHSHAVVHTNSGTDGVSQHDFARLPIGVLTSRNNRLTKGTTLLRPEYLVAVLVDVVIHNVGSTSRQIGEDVFPNKGRIGADSLIHDVRWWVKLPNAVIEDNGRFCISTIDVTTKG